MHENNYKIWDAWPRTLLKANSDLYGSALRNLNRAKTRLKSEESLLNAFFSLHPEAAAGNPNLTILSETVDALEQFIWEQPFTSHEKKKSIQYLIRILNKGINDLYWSVEKIPCHPNTIKKPFNPITERNFKDLARFEDEIDVFEQAFLDTDKYQFSNGKKFTQDELTQLAWGRFYYTCARFSALLDTDAFIEMLNEDIQIKRYGQYVWITLFDHQESKLPLRRFFPDEISIILWHQVKSKQFAPPIFEDQKHKKNWVTDSILKFRKTLDSSFNSSYSTWLSCMETWHGLTLPPILMRMANGQQKTTAFKENVWLRMISNTKVKSVAAKSLKSEENWQYAVQSVHFQNQSHRANFDKEYDQLSKILQPRRDSRNRPLNRDKGIAVKKLKALASRLNSPPQILHALIFWLIKKIEVDKNETVSVYQYLNNIGSFLLSKLASQDLTNLTAENFIGVYSELLSNASARNTKKNKFSQLQQFHHFMTIYYGVEQIDFRLDEELSGVVDANARFMTEHEFLELFNKLINNKRSLAQESAAIACLLSYRCGLRINEVVNIRIRDLHFPLAFDEKLLHQAQNFSVSLKIRSHDYNKLKSLNGTRTLPLHLLLSRKEMEILINHYEKVIYTLGSKQNHFIFPSDKVFGAPISAYDVCNYVIPVMRQVTGDPEIVFHQLRHSFANQLFMLVSHLQTITPLPAHWLNEKLTYSFEGCLKTVLFKESDYSRSHPYQIMEWLGHGSPEMTLSAYIHWSDYLIRKFLDRNRLHHKSQLNHHLNPVMNNIQIKEIIMKLLNISDDMFRHMAKSNQKNMIVAVAKRLKIKSIVLKAHDEKYIPSENNITHLEPQTLDLRDWINFFHIFKNTQDITKATSLFYLSDEVGRKILNNLAKLSAKGSKGEYLLLPKPLDSKASNKNYKSSDLSLEFFKKFGLIFPEPPRGVDIEIAEKIFSKLKLLLIKNTSTLEVALSYFIKNFRLDGGYVLIDESKDSLAFKSIINNLIIQGMITHETPLTTGTTGKYIRGKLHVKHLTHGKAQANHGFRYALMIFCVVYLGKIN